MDIQKLAAEMGLHCITTYKLDALKAVCRSNESNDMTTPSCRKDAEGVTLQSSDSPRLQMEKNQCSTEAFAADFACQENGRWILFMFVVHELLFYTCVDFSGAIVSHSLLTTLPYGVLKGKKRTFLCFQDCV